MTIENPGIPESAWIDCEVCGASYTCGCSDELKLTCPACQYHATCSDPTTPSKAWAPSTKGPK